MTAGGACPECTDVAVPGFERCYEHLGPAERTRVIQSEDPEIRAAATDHWRKSKGGASPSGGPGGAGQISCPHCHVTGRVTTERIRVKRGVSGGKATGAILTGGLSMLGTGLSRKQMITSLRCGSCRMSWTVD